MDEAQRKSLAFKLIEITGQALKELNDGGTSLPADWKIHIKKSLFLNVVGKPIRAKDRAKHIEIATEALDYKISYIQWRNARGKEGASKVFGDVSYNQYIDELCEKYDLSDRRQIFKVIRKYKMEAIQNILQGRKALTIFMIAMSKLANQEPDAAAVEAYDTIKHIESQETRLTRIADWIKAGRIINVS